MVWDGLGDDFCGGGFARSHFLWNLDSLKLKRPANCSRRRKLYGKTVLSRLRRYCAPEWAGRFSHATVSLIV